MTKDEAMKLALEALEICEKYGYIPMRSTRDAVAALRERLAQPEQEPVAMHEDWYDSNSCGHCGMVGGHASTCRHYKPTSSPASKPWVGLTDEERDEIYNTHEPYADLKAVEAKLRERNEHREKNNG